LAGDQLEGAPRMHGYGPGGPLELVTCEGPLGSMLVTPLGGGVALGVALSADAMVGAVRFALRAAARDLVPLVGG
ncbi:MAG TPA: hypothetical protein PKA64_18480, partial [Myxococcota bacterium]|nr:hypothetical protein [Myxococcota bacterium]